MKIIVQWAPNPIPTIKASVLACHHITDLASPAPRLPAVNKRGVAL